jgi:hypothetical protein
VKNVFVIWKDSISGMWHTVAKLSRLESGYRFNYTRGAQSKYFEPFPRMNNVSKIYHSASMFSFFSNRIIPSNRPELKKMLDWSDIDLAHYDELDLLGISGGARSTDEFRIVPEPEMTKQGQYKIKFFINGVNHLSAEQKERVSRLVKNEVLEFKYENSNPFDDKAILMLTKDEVKIGYCPKYYNSDVRSLLENLNLKNHSLRVVKINSEAPSQFKILCEFTTEWPLSFQPMLSEEYLAFNNISQNQPL